MPSFDIVNEVNIGELENAINNTIREVTTRYDFKNSHTTVTLDRKEKVIHIVTSDDYKMETVESLIRGHCLRRKVDPKCLEFKKSEPTSQGAVKKDIKIIEGMQKEVAKKIVEIIKRLGIKVQTSIQDEQVRVSGKKIDDLQTVIQTLKAQNFEIPLQYMNMKS